MPWPVFPSGASESVSDAGPPPPGRPEERPSPSHAALEPSFPPASSAPPSEAARRPEAAPPRPRSENSKVESTVQCCLIAGEGRILDFGASWPRMARCSLARRIIVNQSFSPRIPQYHIPTATLEKILMNNVYIFTHTFTYREISF